MSVLNRQLSGEGLCQPVAIQGPGSELPLILFHRYTLHRNSTVRHLFAHDEDAWWCWQEFGQ